VPENLHHRFLRRTFMALLGFHGVVKVVFTNHPCLGVPDFVRPRAGQTAAFEYGLDLPIQIPDLLVDENGIRATLSFDRVPCGTFVPWEAVVTLGPVAGETIPRMAQVTARRRSSLRLVPPQDDVPGLQQEAAGPAGRPGPRLTLVPRKEMDHGE